MTSEVTYIVDPGGTGDYISLQAFAAVAKDLVALDTAIVVKCKSSNGKADTSQVTFSGWTTDATRNITIVPADIDSHHKGVWSPYMYRLQVAHNLAYAFKIEDVGYIRLRGLQISGGGNEASTWDSVIDVVGTSTTSCDGVEVSGCIIRPGPSTKFFAAPTVADIPTKAFKLLSVRSQNVASGTATVDVFNNLFLSTMLTGKMGSLPCLISRPVISISAGNDSSATTLRVYVDNNTFHKHATGVYSYAAVTVEARNNLFHLGRGPLQDIDGTISTTTTTHNATTRGLLTNSGTGTRTSQTFSFANLSKEDFQLATDDAGARNFGTDHGNLPTGLLSTHNPFSAPEGPVDVVMVNRPFGCEGVDPDPVKGCTDPEALNYKGKATVDDGSCQYPKPACPSDNLWTLAAKFGPGVAKLNKPATGDGRYHNSETPLDVDNNGLIDSADYDKVVTWLNAKGSDLPVTRGADDPLVDVSNDNVAAPGDSNQIGNAITAHGPIRVKDIRVSSISGLSTSSDGKKITSDYEIAAKVWAKLGTIDTSAVKGELTGHDPYDSTDTDGPTVEFADFRNPISFVIEKDPTRTSADANENQKGHIYWITVYRPPHNEVSDDGGGGNSKVHLDDFHGKLWQANLDGTSPRVLYDNLVNPCDLTIDVKGHLYWTERLRTNADEGVGHGSQAGFGLYAGFIMRGRRSQEVNFSYIDKDIFVVIPATTWEPTYKGTNWPVNSWALADDYGVVLPSPAYAGTNGVNQNLSHIYDINNDGTVNDADSDAVIAAIGGTLSATPTSFYDTSEDGFIGSMDTLLTVNYITKHGEQDYARGGLGYGSYPAGIDYDPVSEKIYWCDAEKRAIYSARVLGGQHTSQKVEKLVDITWNYRGGSNLRDALARYHDPIIRKDSAGRSGVPVGYGYCPYGIAVDGDNRHIYFSKGVIIIPPQGATETDSNYHDHDGLSRDRFSIARINVDGTGEIKIDGDIASAPLSLALDSKNSKLYYPHASGLSSYVSDASQLANVNYNYYESRETIFDSSAEVFRQYGNDLTLSGNRGKVKDTFDETSLIYFKTDSSSQKYIPNSKTPVATSASAEQAINNGTAYVSPAEHPYIRYWDDASGEASQLKLFQEWAVARPHTWDLGSSPDKIGGTNNTLSLAFITKIPLGAKIVSAKLKCQFYEEDPYESPRSGKSDFLFKDRESIVNFLKDNVPSLGAESEKMDRSALYNGGYITMDGPAGLNEEADALCKLKGYNCSEVIKRAREGKTPNEGGWKSPKNNGAITFEKGEWKLNYPIPKPPSYNYWNEAPPLHRRDGGTLNWLTVSVNCFCKEDADELPNSGNAIHHRIYGDLSIGGKSNSTTLYPYCETWHPTPGNINQRKTTINNVAWYDDNLRRILAKEPESLGVYPPSNEYRIYHSMVDSPDLTGIVQEIVDSGGDDNSSQYALSQGLVRLMVAAVPRLDKKTNCKMVASQAATPFWNARIPVLEVTYKIKMYSKGSGVPASGLVRVTVGASGATEKVTWDTSNRRIEYIGLDDQWFLGGGEVLPCDPDAAASSSSSNLIVVDESAEVDAHSYYNTHISTLKSHIDDSDLGAYSQGASCSGKTCARWKALAEAIAKLEVGPQTVSFTYSFILDGTASTDTTFDHQTLRDYYDGGTYHTLAFPNVAGGPSNAQFKAEIVLSFAEWKTVLEAIFHTSGGFKNNLTVNFTNLGDETGTTYPSDAYWVGDPDGVGKGGYSLPGTENLGDIRIGMVPLAWKGVYASGGVLAQAGSLRWPESYPGHGHTAARVLGEVGDYGADIKFDQFDLWRTDGTTRAGSVSIKYVATHEIGHTLGLYPDAYDGDGDAAGANSAHDVKNGFKNIMHWQVAGDLDFADLWPSGLASSEIMTLPNGLTEVFKALYGLPSPVTKIKGCTDPDALNYDSDATQDDGTCTYLSVFKGCTDLLANNYDEDASCDDGSCEYDEDVVNGGCMDPLALNYDATATVTDGSCQYNDDVPGCMDPNASNFNPDATEAAKPGIFWVEYAEPVSTGNIGKLDLTAGTNSYILSGATNGINQPVDLVHYKDPTSTQDYIFFTEENAGAGRIYKAKEDGTGAPKVIISKTELGLATFYPQGITVDEGSGHIFFIAGNTATGSIWRATIDGNDITEIVTNVNNGRGITIDSQHNWIYWVEGGAAGVIKKAAYAGTNLTTVKTIGEQLYGIALYFKNGVNNSPTNIFFTTDTQLRRGTISGSRLTDLQFLGIKPSQRHIVSDSFGKRVYWIGGAQQYSSAFGSGADKDGYKILSLAAETKDTNGQWNLNDLATAAITVELSLPNDRQLSGIGMDMSKTCTYATVVDCVDIGFSESSQSTLSKPIVKNAWTNVNNRYDVNNDGCVDSTDAQLLVDAIASGIYLNGLPNSRPTGAPYYDVNGNGSVTSLDVSLVLDYVDTYGDAKNQVCYNAIDEDCGDYMELEGGVVLGCVDPAANNYNAKATKDNGSCEYAPPQDILGCTNAAAINYNPKATKEDNTCVFKPDGDTCPADAINRIVNGDFETDLSGWAVAGDYGLGLPEWDKDTQQVSLVYRSVLSQTIAKLSPESNLTIYFDYMQDYADDQVAYVTCSLRGSGLNKLADITVPYTPGQVNTFFVNTIVPADGEVIVEFFTPTFPHDCANPPRPHLDNIRACAVPIIPGCTDPEANNYNSAANKDDGSCEYDPPVIPCDVDLSRVDAFAISNSVVGFPKQVFSAVAGDMTLFTLAQFVNSVTKVKEMVWKFPVAGGSDAWQAVKGLGLQCKTTGPSLSVKTAIIYEFGAPALNEDIPYIVIPYKASTIRLTYDLVSIKNGGAGGALGVEVIAVYADTTQKVLASTTVSLAGAYDLNVQIPDNDDIINRLQIKFSPKSTATSVAKQLDLVLDNIDVHCCDCKIPDPGKEGCTDPKACNYDPDAKVDNGSCVYPEIPDCGEITYSPWGRYQLGVDQSQGGEKYPFVDPSTQLGQLIADLYLSYLDDAGSYVPPLKVDWLAGFGCVPVDIVDACDVSPEEYNVQISDATGAIVYTTTTAEKFTQVEWSDYYRVLEWTSKDGEMLRIVLFTAWSDSDSTSLLDWKTYFEPVNGELDPRAYSRIPRHVTKVSIVNPFVDGKVSTQEVTIFEQSLEGTNNANLLFQSGYNLVSEIDNPTLSDGGKYVTALNFDVKAGAGLGKFDNCDELEREVFRINGIAPTALGQFLTDAGDCYRVERVPQAAQTVPPTDLAYGSAVISGSVQDSELTSPNGIVHSRVSANVLYTHNRVSDVGRIFARSPAGVGLATFNLIYGSGHANAGNIVVHTDFRDIAAGDGDLFVADTGDNDLVRGSNSVPKPLIYRFTEPTDFTATSVTVKKIYEITFSDHKQHNVAAVMFDPVSGDLYLFTKETTSNANTSPHHSFVYKIASKALLTAATAGIVAVTAEKDATIGPSSLGGTWINAGGISAVDISSDGRLIIARDTAEFNISNTAWTHHAKFWVRSIGETVAEALDKAPKDASLPAVVDEPHGTGIAFNPNVSAYGYYTVGEGLTPAIYAFAGNAVEPVSAVVTPATLRVSNDCGPCCECQDFINVYEAIRKLMTKYNELGKRAEAVRDLYLANKKRWEDSKSCRAGQNLRIISHAVPICRAALAVGICNNTDEKITDVTLTIDFTGSDRDGHILANTTIRSGNEGPTPADRTTVYELQGSWPNYTAHFDCISPGRMGQVTFMMKFPDCIDGDIIRVKLSSDQGTTFQDQEHSFDLKESIGVIAESMDCPEDDEPPFEI